MKKRFFLCLAMIFPLFIVSCGKKNPITAPSSPSTATSVLSATVTGTVPTASITQTASFTPTATHTGTQFIASATATLTSTKTMTGTITQTHTVSVYSMTITQTSTQTFTPSVTETATASATSTVSETATQSPSPSLTNTNTQTITLTLFLTPTITPTFGGNRGDLALSPSTLTSGSSGNVLTFTYTAGELGWIGPNPLYGTLKIQLPSDWSLPSLTLTDSGYFSVALPNGGSLIGVGVNTNEIVIKVADLPAVTGKIVVTYGDRTYGSAGAVIGSAGSFVINAEAGEAGDTTHPVNSNPSAIVLPPTQTVTPTFTPVIGQGSVNVLPSTLTDNTFGNTVMFTYTAGNTAWTSAAEGGMIKITLPSGWSAPQVEDTEAGCFYAFASGGAEVVDLQEQGMSMIVRVRNLPANTGTITIVYGYKGKGGPGAYVSGIGTFETLCETDIFGSNIYPIAVSPFVNVVAPTSTITMTSTMTVTGTVTPTITQTETVTDTFTITQTATDTGTETITPTITETATVTETITNTITFTITVTSTSTPTATVTYTITPSWELIGTQGLSSGRIYYSSIAMDGGVPYIAYSDGSLNNRVIVKKYSAGVWSDVGTNPVSDGIAYDVKLVVYGGIPYVAYRDYPAGNTIKVKRYVDSSWEELFVAGHPAASDGAAYELSFTVDTDGTPWVAYRDEKIGNGGKLSVRQFNVVVGWMDMGTAITADVASDISIKVYSGEPYVAFSDWSMNFRTRVIKKDFILGWQSVGSSPLTLASAYSNSLVIDTDGSMFAAFRETNNYNRVSVMKYSAGTWSYYGGTPDFSSDNCDEISLAVHQGTPYTAYRDGGRGNSLTVARNKVSWNIVGYNISNQSAEHIDITFDTVNKMPYVVFADENRSYKATVMRYTGTY